jgi:hypothetical protein
MALSNPILDRIFSGEIPPAGRLAAAKGLLPLSREELLELAVRLRQDPDEEVRMAAQDTLFEFKAEELAAMGKGEDFHPDTFAFIWRSLKNREELFEGVLLSNTHMPANVVLQVAGEGGERLTDVIVINQQRLINYPEMIVALLRNPKTSRNTVRLLFEIREQFLKERTDFDPLFKLRLGVDTLISQSASAAPAPAPPPAPVPAPAAAPTPAPAGAAPAAAGEAAAETGEGEDAEAGEAPAEELIDESTEEFKNAYAKIMNMNVPEKVSLALLGNREERAILIRESVKLISEAVLDSPKLTPDEIRGFIRLRSLPEGLVRKIAGNKDWMKDDVVMMGVVRHPKTPNALFTTLLVRVNEKALKKLGKDKEVSEIVRRTVRRYIDAKEQAKRQGDKKH